MASQLPALTLTPEAEILPPGMLGLGEILEAFGHVDPQEPDIKPALRAALADPMSTTTAMLTVLDLTPFEVNAFQNENLENDAEYYTHVLAMFILAAFGETRAFPKIIRFFHGQSTDDLLWSRMAEHVTGDLAVDDLPLILAATYDGDIGPLLDMVCDPKCELFVRIAGVEALFQMVAAAKLSRDEAIAYLGTLIAKVSTVEVDDGFFWGFLVQTAARFASERLRQPLRALVEADGFNRFELPWSEVEKDYATPWADHVAKHYHPQHLRELDTYLGDHIGAYWPCGPAPGKRDARGEGNLAANLATIKKYSAIIKDLVYVARVTQPTYRREAPKTGRNEPCPCGSGQKYKKCCIDTD